MKRGRKSRYEQKILLNKKNIRSMFEQGATEKQVYKWLGISADTFYRWKKQYPELSELCKEARQKLISDLRGKLVERAMGYSYTESKTVTKIVDGVKQEVTETYNKQALPDVTALNLCLKNYDKENWANDPQMLDIKKEENEIKRKKAEADDW